MNILVNKMSQKLIKEDKIIRWPKKVIEKEFILEYISKKIISNKKYSEKEINQIIIENILFVDYVLIRRELVERGYLNRTKDCKEYWKDKK